MTVYGAAAEEATIKAKALALRVIAEEITLRRDGWPRRRFAFHDTGVIGPVMLSEIARHTGLRPESDL